MRLLKKLFTELSQISLSGGARKEARVSNQVQDSLQAAVGQGPEGASSPQAARGE